MTDTLLPPLADKRAQDETCELRPAFNGDGLVSGADLAFLLGLWGTNDPVADLDGSGTVGPSDLAIVLGNWFNP